MDRTIHTNSRWIRHLLILAVSLGALYLTSLWNYLLFHSLAEIYSIVVAFSVFIIGWASRRSNENGYFLFLGIGFFFIAGLDSLHTLVYKGMGVLPGSDANLPTQLWIATRYLQSISLLVAPIFLRRKINPGATLLSFALLTAVLLVTIFGGIFPVCYVEGAGLTPFKIVSEYIISAILLGALGLLFKHRLKFDPYVLRWLEIAMIATILSEVAFTSYVSVVGFANLLGHLFKIIAFYALFLAIVETGFYRPFNLLLRDLRQNEEALRIAQAELERRVAERTGQLARSNLELRKENAERQRVETALRESETRFRLIFEASPLGVALIGLDGQIRAHNPIFAQMLGCVEGDLSRGRFQQFIAPEDRAESETAFSQLVTGKANHYYLELRCLPCHGQPLWANLSMSLVRDDAGQPGFAILMIEDTTERKRIQAELAEVQRRLMDSQEAERLNLARELHDGPIQDLMAIALQLQIQLSDLEGDQGEPLETIQDQVTRVGQTLREVCGQLRPQALAPFGLEKAIRSHVGSFQASHPEIEIQMDLWPDGRELPETTRLALFRIVQQALNNIARHARATQVWIRFSQDADKISLDIEDNGCGFELPKGWIHFVRAGHLGMAGMSERAEALGGKVHVCTSPGNGTQIRVEIPRGKIGAGQLV